KAIDFAKRLIEFAAPFGAALNLGSMQGQGTEPIPRPVALRYLGHALYKLDEHAGDYDAIVLHEPRNRYETNLINSVADGLSMLRGLGTSNVRILADLFHMNLEEANLCESLRLAGPQLGHVHFADSNRKAAGWGHTDFAAVVRTLREIGYD